MSRLLRDRVLILDACKALLILLAGFGLPVGQEAQVWIMAVLVAGFGLLEAIQTNESVMVSVTELVQAAGVLAIGFGLNWTSEQLATVVTFTGVVLTLLQRQQMSPVAGRVVTAERPASSG